MAKDAAKAKPAKKAGTKKAAAGKKEKKEKDPNAPKKPLGAYMYFCKEKRQDVVKANPGASLGEVGKELGALWKKLADKDKKKFEDLAAKDKVRYEKENAAYKAK